MPTRPSPVAAELACSDVPRVANPGETLSGCLIGHKGWSRSAEDKHGDVGNFQSPLEPVEN